MHKRDTFNPEGFEFGRHVDAPQLGEVIGFARGKFIGTNALSGGIVEAVKNPAKKAEHTPGVARRRGEPAQKQPQVVVIGWLHGARRVAGPDHGLFDESGEPIERRGCC